MSLDFELKGREYCVVMLGCYYTQRGGTGEGDVLPFLALAAYTSKPARRFHQT